MNEKKKKKIIELITTTLNMMDPSGENSKKYKDLLSGMSLKELEKFVKEIKDKKRQIYIQAPNMKLTIKVKDLLKVCDKLGIKLFHHLRIFDDVSKKYYKTPQKYLVLNLPVRRVSQSLEHKRSVPDSDSKVSILTGQVIKPDKASSLSSTESNALLSQGYEKVLTEFLNIRGGSAENYASFKAELEETGQASFNELDPTLKPKANLSLSSYFRAMHLDNNF